MVYIIWLIAAIGMILAYFAVRMSVREEARLNRHKKIYYSASR